MFDAESPAEALLDARLAPVSTRVGCARKQCATYQGIAVHRARSEGQVHLACELTRAASAARVVLRVQVFQALARHVRVDLRRRQ